MSSRPRSRQLARAIGAALGAIALGLLPAACGVPGSGLPVVVGNAPRLGARTDTAPVSPAGPEKANDAQQLVELYLQAAAWGNAVTTDRPHAAEEAADRVRQFLTPAAASRWRPGTRLTVVQRRFGAQATLPDRAVRVEVTLQSVGVLSGQGSVTPVPPVSYLHQFEVVSVDGGGLRISNPPDGMLLSSEGLRGLYEAQQIYFWDSLGHTLVPDLRYLAKAVEPAKRPNEVVNWLLAGASGWLSPAVLVPPAGVELRDRVVAQGQRADSPLLVNLTAKAAGVESEQLRHLLIQLQWSLQPFGRPVQLSIEGRAYQGSVTAAEVAGANRAASASADPARYCVVAGQVRQFAGAPQTVPALATEVNATVVSAAINASLAAAFVRRDPPGKLRLWLATPELSEPGGPRYLATDLTATVMSRPVWLRTPGPRVLIVADTGLWEVSSRGQVHQVPAPDGVTAVAVAPDGRRVALVAGGRVYLAPLLVEGDALQIGPGHEVASGLTDPVGVAFSREDRVIVAGLNAGTAGLAEVTVDGATVELLNLTNLGGLKITLVVAYPRTPVPRGIVLIEANDRAYHVFSGQVEEVTLASPALPSAAPSAVPLPPVPVLVPSAPFFMD